jgi:sugar O-acyltransferase (sialic acid O-acetyltransferase NeuD family)
MSCYCLVLGSGGHARSVIDILEEEQKWIVSGLITNDKSVGELINGYRVLGGDDDLINLRKHYKFAVIGVGQIKSANVRMRLAGMLADYGYKVPTIISPYAYVSTKATLGVGVSIGHGAIINSGATVNDYTIINSGALIEHDATIAEFSHISTKVIVNGNVYIGAESFVGSGSIIREGLSLPRRTLISAGTRVMGWPNRH